MRALPSIRDTRVTVSAVLGQLSAGASIHELLVDYPYLEPEDILSALERAPAAQRSEVAAPGLSDLGARAHRIVESPEGELIDDAASVKHLLGL